MKKSTSKLQGSFAAFFAAVLLAFLAYFAIMGETKPLICTENWSCSEWSVCENDKQSRICKGLNNCNTSASKPAESRECKAEPIKKTEELPTGYIAVAAIGIAAILAGILYKIGKGKAANIRKRRLH